MITLKELASRCQVSIATISNILNGKANVSEQTRQRVLDVIKETGYKPNYMASTLRSGKTRTIGLIIDELTAFSTAPIVDGIMETFENAGYKTIIENLRIYNKYENLPQTPEYIDSLQFAINQLMAFMVDGIIFVAANRRHTDLSAGNVSVPFVTCYTSTLNPDIPYVDIDDFSASYQLTNYLIEKGNRSIAIIAGDSTSVYNTPRLNGFLQAMRENNLTFDQELYIEADWTRKSGYEACKKLFLNKKIPDAIYCFNDLMAAGVYDFLYEKNLKPGQDVAVAGYDNREVSEYLMPSLTTVEIPLKEVGTKTAEYLLKKLSGTEPLEKSILVPCRLIKRKSV